MGVDGDRLIVVAEVAGIVGAEQTCPRGARKRWPSEEERRPSPQTAAKRGGDARSTWAVGRLHRGLAHQPARGLLECRRSGPRRCRPWRSGRGWCRGRSGWPAGRGRCPGPRLVAGERPEGAGEAAAPVDVEQDVLDAHPRHPGLDLPAQLGVPPATRARHRAAAGRRLLARDGGEVVGARPADERAGRPVR